MKIIAMDLR